MRCKSHQQGKPLPFGGGFFVCLVKMSSFVKCRVEAKSIICIFPHFVVELCTTILRKPISRHVFYGNPIAFLFHSKWIGMYNGIAIFVLDKVFIFSDGSPFNWLVCRYASVLLRYKIPIVELMTSPLDYW